MKTNLRKTACAALAGAVFFSMTGCSALEGLTEKEKEPEDLTEEIMDTAEDYCDAVKDLNVDKLVDLSADDLEDKKEEMEAALDFDGDLYSEDMGAILSAIADTITYEIDEDSAEADEDEGSVDVTFTVFDTQADENEFGDDIESLDEALELIGDGTTCEIKLTLELENTDDGWKVKDTEDITSDVYEFMVMGTLFPDYTVGGAASYDISEEDVISAAYDLSDALLDNDVDVYFAFSAEEHTDEELDTARAECDFSNRELYSEDLEAILNAYKDMIYYVIDEDSVVFDEETGTANITVTYYTCDPWNYDSMEGMDLSTLDSFLEYIADTPCEGHTVIVEFQMTDSGWVVNNLGEIREIVQEYTWLALMGPDFDYETAYAETYSNVEFTTDPAEALGDCNGFGFSGYAECDWDTHTIYLDAGERSFGVGLSYCIPAGGSRPDFTGYYVVYEYEGEIIATFEDTVYTDYETEDGNPVPAGEYTITFYNPDDVAIASLTLIAQ